MDGLDNISKIQQRIVSEKAETVLFESLMAQAAQGNIKATQAAIAIKKNPSRMTSILEDFYEEEEQPAEQQLPGQQAAEPDIASFLAQLGGPPPGA
jgi:hypothetical protein